MVKNDGNVGNNNSDLMTYPCPEHDKVNNTAAQAVSK